MRAADVVILEISKYLTLEEVLQLCSTERHLKLLQQQMMAKIVKLSIRNRSTLRYVLNCPNVSIVHVHKSCTLQFSDYELLSKLPIESFTDGIVVREKRMRGLQLQSITFEPFYVVTLNMPRLKHVTVYGANNYNFSRCPLVRRIVDLDDTKPIIGLPIEYYFMKGNNEILQKLLNKVVR